ncbi:MAG TPA: transglycosylase domain-containing protein [Vicinamibacteria bacterium]|nr:transglycosylase domain-containing protein [Vicinamibacteria bacterium]
MTASKLRVALGSLLALLAVLAAGKGLERQGVRFLERSLSKKLRVPVRVAALGLRGGLAARGVHIEDQQRGVVLALDRVAVGWNRIDIEGGDLTLEERALFGESRPQPPEEASSGVRLPSFWSADVVRFERLSVSLVSPEGTRKLGTLRGEIARGEKGMSGHIVAGMESLEADGSFSAVRGDSGEIHFETDLDLRALGLTWAPVSRGPIHGNVRVELAGSWKDANLGVSRGRLRSAGAELEWSGNVALSGEGPVVDLNLSLARTECQKVIDAIPAGVMGEFSGFVLDGTLSGRARLQIAPERPELTRFEVSVRDRCRFRKVPAAAALSRFRGPFTHRVVVNRGGAEGGIDEALTFETGPTSPHWVPLANVSPFFLQAVLAQEDAQFLTHAGFLPDAFETALARNLEEGRFASGGSTISMQLARNLFLVREKTLSRKVQELVLTWWLEKSLAKREIFELYVNLIEFGPGVYGIGPASEHYFGCAPSSLSPAEAAFLATVLPSPARRHRDYERGGLSSWSRARVEQLLRRMWERGRIDEEALFHGMAEVPWLTFHHGPVPRLRRHEDFGRAALLPFS